MNGHLSINLNALLNFYLYLGLALDLIRSKLLKMCLFLQIKTKFWKKEVYYDLFIPFCVS